MRWELKRRYSASPGLLGGLLAAVAGTSLLIASVAVWFGAWMVMPFAMVEVLALCVAFWVIARRSEDQEVVTVEDSGWVRVEHIAASGVSVYRLPGHWLKVEPPSRRGAQELGLAEFASGRTRIVVGRYVGPDQREAFLKEFKKVLEQCTLAHPSVRLTA